MKISKVLFLSLLSLIGQVAIAADTDMAGSQALPKNVSNNLLAHAKLSDDEQGWLLKIADGLTESQTAELTSIKPAMGKAKLYLEIQELYMSDKSYFAVDLFRDFTTRYANTYCHWESKKYDNEDAAKNFLYWVNHYKTVFMELANSRKKAAEQKQ